VSLFATLVCKITAAAFLAVNRVYISNGDLMEQGQ